MRLWLVLGFFGLSLVYLLTSIHVLYRLDSAQGPIQHQPVNMVAGAAARLPALYLAHGGGPLPVLGEPGHLPLTKFMTRWPSTIPRPAAILVISAHFEAPTARVTSGASPPLIYDYYGFPEEAYSIQYPSPGDPALASKVADALRAAGMECVLDAKRGYDHGHFIPLKLMYPHADIPTVQLSLRSSLDAEEHIRMGESLAPLRDQGVLVLGSGLSFHNMAAFDFRGRGHTEALSRSKEFDDYLQDAMTNPAYSWAQRRQRLVDWAQAPAARFCHPREEHLLPLMVAFGASKGEEAPATSVFHEKLLGVWVSSFQFGGLVPPSAAT